MHWLKLNSKRSLITCVTIPTLIVLDVAVSPRKHFQMLGYGFESCSRR